MSKVNENKRNNREQNPLPAKKPRVETLHHALQRDTIVDRLLEIKITLRDVKPKVWRRVIASSEASLYEFAKLILLAFQWKGEKPHQFITSDGVPIGIPTDDTPCIDERDVKIGQVLRSFKCPITFEYGDDAELWEHKIILEKISKHESSKYNVPIPRCIDGENACPIEGCGGPEGYEQLKSILADKTHPQYFEKQFLIMESQEGTWDPSFFDVDDVNKKLLEKANIKHEHKFKNLSKEDIERMHLDSLRHDIDYLDTRYEMQEALHNQ